MYLTDKHVARLAWSLSSRYIFVSRSLNEQTVDDVLYRVRDSLYFDRCSE